MPDRALAVSRHRYGDHAALSVEWDFSVHGGSFGQAEADLFTAACAAAVDDRLPLVTRLRSGGTRLTEGMHALVGIPRVLLALDTVAAAGLPHLCVADSPTTGGVWVAVGAGADVRIAVTGAVVGFSGPRVVAAMTGVELPEGANTAQAAAAAGLVDAVADAGDVHDWVGRALAALAPDSPLAVAPAGDPPPSRRRGWEQVEHSRLSARPAGAQLLDDLLEPGAVALGSATTEVAARVGRVRGRRVVAVALAAERAARVRPAGFRLLSRAADLAGRLDLGLVVLVDTAGADPLPDSERDGVVPAIAAATRAVLHCTAPTVAVVHGAGGSGGALAGAVTDHVAVTDTGWFAALGPEGAAAALRLDVREAADLMRPAPAALLASGFADGTAPGDGPALAGWLATRLDALRAEPRDARLARRRSRWAGPLPGSPRLP